ncbi:MAG: APC family permease [Candidatus Woesearchaeota archaeon]
MFNKLKGLLIGKPLPNWEYKHQRLSKKIALAVFSSDALSSVAYATEEILLVLIVAGTLALSYALPIALAIIVLLTILIISYSQTIKAYPQGGGSYIVSKDNLGTTAGLVAASALMLDYILTVAVSVAAGVAALTSAFPVLFPERIIIGVGVIIFITIMNLKGIKESGTIFAIPTYMFIVSFLAMISIGFWKYATGTLTPVIIQTQTETMAAISIFLLLRAFAAGCAALTGIEAISDGVKAFREPESKNARITLVMMGVILAVLFFGITFLIYQMHITPMHDRTLISILAENIFNGRNIFFFFIQGFTMLILVLAANTGFADFPRLCYFLAKDKFLPRQFTHLGERLVFSNGIILLGILSSLLIILFKGNVHYLIPLYAVGVFTSFTLSQTGMVVKHFKDKKNNWKISAAVNALGAFITLVALIIILYAKFTHGAWIIVVMIGLLILMFKEIRLHYNNIAKQLSVQNMNIKKNRPPERHLLIVLVPSYNSCVVRALDFAKSLNKKTEALHVNLKQKETDQLLEYWKKNHKDIKLTILKSPYRKLIEPISEYINKLEDKDERLNITIVIPEFVPHKWWHNILHNQTGLAIKTSIHFRKRTHFINVQYHMDE